MYRFISRIRFSRHSLALTIFCLGLLSTAGISYYDRRLTNQAEKAHAQETLVLSSTALEQVITYKLFLLYTLEALVHHQHQTKHESLGSMFEAVVPPLHHEVVGILSLQLAPNGIVDHVTDPDRNQAAIGHDLLKTERSRPTVLQAIHSRQITLEGPVDLIQGGQGLIARKPIFVAGSNLFDAQEAYATQRATPQETWPQEVPSEFWGLATIVLETKQIYAEAKLNNLPPLYDYAIVKLDDRGKYGPLIWGKTSVLVNPLAQQVITLPQEHWVMMARLKHPVGLFHGLQIAGLGLLGSGLSSFLVLVLAKKQADDDSFEKERVAMAEAARLKDQFLANMSHELRTPLNSILGMTELLLDPQVLGRVNDRQQQLLHKISLSGQHLLNLINETLDMAKIQAGKLKLHRQEVSIVSLCQSSLALIEAQAQRKNILLQLHLPLCWPLVSYDLAAHTQMILTPNTWTTPLDLPHHLALLPPLSVDKHRMQQVLVNLLANAIKFSPCNTVVVLAVEIQPCSGSTEAKLIEAKPGNQVTKPRNPLNLGLVVKDQGIGIAPDDLMHLFEPFSQVESDLNRQYDGTGLGLALVKRIVDLHGGKIRVNSTEGVGSMFTVELPWIDRGTEATPPKTSVQGSPDRANPLNPDPSSIAIPEIHCPWADFPQIPQSSAAPQAQPSWVTLPGGKRSALQLAEMQQPWAGLPNLKQAAMAMPEEHPSWGSEPQANPAPPTLLPQDRFADYAYHTDRLTLHRHPALQSSHHTPPPKCYGPKVRILLVEDNADNRLAVVSYLEAKGYQVVSVFNGRSAIDYLRATLVDLVLMDMNMPGMDGFEATQRIRKDLGLGDLPIIAVTALAMLGDRESCLAAGATEYLAKPFRLKYLVELIQQLLFCSVSTSTGPSL